MHASLRGQTRVDYICFLDHCRSVYEGGDFSRKRKSSREEINFIDRWKGQHQHGQGGRGEIHWVRDRYNRGTDVEHRWALPSVHYPRNMVIYHYPPIGVIFMVILHVFTTKNYPNFSSNYYPKHTIWVICPLYLILENLYTKSVFLNITRSHDKKRNFSLFLVPCF